MKRYTVYVSYEGVEENAFSYETAENEQVCERFERVVKDKKLAEVTVETASDGVWRAFEKTQEEDREYKGDRLVSFDMPKGDVRITAKYVADENRVRLQLDLRAVRDVMTEERGPSYFYSTQEDWNGDSNDLEEGKTYYYDDGEEMTFVLRLNVDADVVLSTGEREYAPVKKEKRQAVYEYTFGFVDDLDPACRTNKPVRLCAPSTTVSFHVK